MLRIDDPSAYFEKLGRLHDARVEEFSWRNAGHQLCIRVDDINSNSLGLEGYPGAQPAEFAFEEVDVIDIDLQVRAPSISIYDLEIENDGGRFRVSISFAPGGKMSLICNAIAMSERRE